MCVCVHVCLSTVIAATYLSADQQRPLQGALSCPFATPRRRRNRELCELLVVYRDKTLRQVSICWLQMTEKCCTAPIHDNSHCVQLTQSRTLANVPAPECWTTMTDEYSTSRLDPNTNIKWNFSIRTDFVRGRAVRCPNESFCVVSINQNSGVLWFCSTELEWRTM